MKMNLFRLKPVAVATENASIANPTAKSIIE